MRVSPTDGRKPTDGRGVDRIRVHTSPLRGGACRLSPVPSLSKEEEEEEKEEEGRRRRKVDRRRRTRIFVFCTYCMYR